MAKRPLVLVGDAPVAEVAYECFTHDSPFKVVAFAVEKAYRKRDRLFDIPVIDFEELSARYPAGESAVFVAVGYNALNRTRTRLYHAVKAMGYEIPSYISSKAMVWPNAVVGENCLILENNVIQPFVRIGHNVLLWSGNHIGHHSCIKNNVYVASHVVVSGCVTIEENCFIGVNVTIADNVTIAADGLLGAGSLILKSTVPAGIYRSAPAELSKVSSLRFYGLERHKAKSL